jgi:predicted transcriptional regulator of viral defense system
MQAIDFFNTHLVFRFSELKQSLGQHPGEAVAEKNCYMTLYNYCKKGKLTHVRKGLYVVNSDSPFQVTPISPFMVAGKATDDAVLAYHTALESHGLAYTDFNVHVYLTAHRTNDFTFQDQRYRAIYQPSLRETSAQKEIETITMLGIKVRRTSLARTIVDVLDRPELSGGWEEVMRSLDRVVAFDPNQAVDYALSLGQASIAAKLGYFFDQRPDYLRIDTKIVERLLPHIPKQPYYIDRKTPSEGVSIKKWGIIVPAYLHKRLWEEPENDIDN